MEEATTTPTKPTVEELIRKRKEQIEAYIAEFFRIHDPETSGVFHCENLTRVGVDLEESQSRGFPTADLEDWEYWFRRVEFFQKVGCFEVGTEDDEPESMYDINTPRYRLESRVFSESNNSKTFFLDYMKLCGSKLNLLERAPPEIRGFPDPIKRLEVLMKVSIKRFFDARAGKIKSTDELSDYVQLLCLALLLLNFKLPTHGSYLSEYVYYYTSIVKMVIEGVVDYREYTGKVTGQEGMDTLQGLIQERYPSGGGLNTTISKYGCLGLNQPEKKELWILGLPDWCQSISPIIGEKKEEESEKKKQEERLKYRKLVASCVFDYLLSSSKEYSGSYVRRMTPQHCYDIAEFATAPIRNQLDYHKQVVKETQRGVRAAEFAYSLVSAMRPTGPVVIKRDSEGIPSIITERAQIMELSYRRRMGIFSNIPFIVKERFLSYLSITCGFDFERKPLLNNNNNK